MKRGTGRWGFIAELPSEDGVQELRYAVEYKSKLKCRVMKCLLRVMIALGAAIADQLFVIELFLGEEDYLLLGDGIDGDVPC